MYVKDRTNVHQLLYHFVFVSKYRKPIFNTEEKREIMKEIFESFTTEEIQMIEMDCLEDHIHLVVYFKPTYSISSIVKKFKGATAKEWFQTYPETKQELWNGHLWMPSYLVGTVGNVSKETVIEYVQSQLTEYNRGKDRKDRSSL